MSWRRGGGGYDLWFNRDESRQRAAAEPPEVHAVADGDCRFVSPIDPVGGGTWLAVNERGLAVGILNLYEAEIHHRPVDPISRGQLVRTLAPHPGATSGGRALKRAVAEDGTRLRPFLLILLDLGSGAHLWRWDGRALTSLDADPPVTTSSFETTEVCAARAASFDPEGPLEKFHRSQDPLRKAFSVRMERPGSCTVSISHIQVGEDGITFRYFADAADVAPARSVSMPLLQAAPRD